MREGVVDDGLRQRRSFDGRHAEGRGRGPFRGGCRVRREGACARGSARNHRMVYLGRGALDDGLVGTELVAMDADLSVRVR